MDGVVITAAGLSLRFGGRPKIFALLGGVPVLAHSVATFAAALPRAALAIACRPEERERVRALAPNATLVDGAATRQASVERALEALPATVTHALVHDAARPLVSVDLVARVHAALLAHGAAAAGRTATDAVHGLDAASGMWLEPGPERGRVFLAQTPQGARRDWLRQAYARAAGQASPALDEVELLTRAGFSVAAVEGEAFNLKLTRPEDLALLEALWSARRTAGRT